MFARIETVSFQGVEVTPIDVQVQISPGLPNFIIVGLADKAVGESKERVRAALNALALALPSKRITVNLAPADVQKEGTHYDLPIAVGLLVSMGVIPQDAIEGLVALGELGLDGAIAPVSGALPAAIYASSVGKGLICPEACGGEAAWAGDLNIIAPNHLLSLINHFKGTQVLSAPEAILEDDSKEIHLDMRDIKGQETAKRALEVAAAGGHHMLMWGPPGSGKSMLASRLSSILPPLTPEEALEVTMIHSLAGQLSEGRLLRTRPFRDPHHSATMPALIGGGIKAGPGEISLAHHGVLFLDELPEFARSTLEALRQPVESGRAVVSRANAHYVYPARIQLMAAMNPCRCGYLSDPERSCSRAPKCALDYQSRISGPLFDRIDIHIDVPEVKAQDLHQPATGETSETIRARVIHARNIQKARFESEGSEISLNAHAEGQLLEKIVNLSLEDRTFLETASERFKLSARGYARVLRVARTIADLANSKTIQKEHLGEALSYRMMTYGGGTSATSSPRSVQYNR
ncbi:YifB family Mg chelatase-like AAA ATPase [Candidatus Bealeia paramacronuclearis]|uniref:YifB family Mg chelatase-like AAA ATPase n=1 Tax=Candidatus Bealeia paramacronuclearis TaxID=1921001 RepID=A0ABZ2C4L4_9PROT|nr:YifB family Mg chelatase-like AAA ATPase [Candidatus Bealeia paramacronuclearis]